ncbi:MAG: DUF998 domain-containing protein [Acidimicrobiales bacterium]
MLPPRERISGVQLTCALASAWVLTTTVVVIGALTPGYSPMRDTISRLASEGQAFAPQARAAFVLYGGLVLVGAGALGCHAPGRQRGLAALIRVFGATAVVAGLAPKALATEPGTRSSHIHVAATVVGGAAILTALILVALHSPSVALRRASLVVAVLTATAVLVFRFSWGSPTYGLVERVVIAPAAFWISALAHRVHGQDQRARLAKVNAWGVHS